jgi:hypothetical protein
MRKVFTFALACSAIAACGQPMDESVPPASSTTTGPTIPTTVQPTTQPAAAGGFAVPQQTQPTAPITNPNGMLPTMAAAGSSAPVVMPSTAGATSMGTAGAGSPVPTATVPQAMQHTPGECNLHTNYASDELCILPPPPDKGFQMHIGPTNYDNPEAKYILAAGQELTSDFPVVSTNDKEIYFYVREYRMRLGAHHNIITSGGGGDSGLGQRIGTVNTLVEDYPKGGLIAPENKGVGIRMPAHTQINVSLHSINTSTKPQLREMWVNFWYRPAAEVTDPVKEVFAIAPMSGIAPKADVTTKGSCNVTGNGRMIWAYGHRHANTVSFTVWRARSGKKDLVYQGYSWEEPITLDYSSTVMNAVPGDAPNEGGWSGILDAKTGDQFVWECHVINQTNGTLNFTNNTYTGEMCILDAEMVGAGCN